MSGRGRCRSTNRRRAVRVRSDRRLLARILVAQTGSGSNLRLRAIVLRPGGSGDLEKRASLLRRDSVHGPFDGTIRIDTDANQIIANGNRIQLIYADGPDQVDYVGHGIDKAIVVDNTGQWRDEAGLSRHLQSPGVDRVLLTAPGKGAVKNIIYGVNDSVIAPEDKVLSAASCTTNAIVPVLKTMHDTFEVVSGHLETVHAYTNDQNLTDNFHSKATGSQRAPEPGHHRDRGSLGGRQGSSRVGRSTHRQRHQGPDPQRVARNFRTSNWARRSRRCHQQSLADDVDRLASA